MHLMYQVIQHGMTLKKKRRTDIRKLSGAEKQTSTVQEETKVKSDKTEQVPVSKTEKSDKTEQIYQQESDERKARKKSQGSCTEGKP